MVSARSIAENNNVAEFRNFYVVEFRTAAEFSPHRPAEFSSFTHFFISNPNFRFRAGVAKDFQEFSTKVVVRKNIVSVVY